MTRRNWPSNLVPIPKAIVQSITIGHQIPPIIRITSKPPFIPRSFAIFPKARPFSSTRIFILASHLSCPIPLQSRIIIGELEFLASIIMQQRPRSIFTSSSFSSSFSNFFLDRKDFAHGTMVTRTSFASSDSELSQPNTRPHSRENGIKIKSHRPR